MKTPDLFRFCFIAVAWLFLVFLLLRSVEKITLYTIFVVVASGIICLVPLYKKYTKRH